MRGLFWTKQLAGYLGLIALTWLQAAAAQDTSPGLIANAKGYTAVKASTEVAESLGALTA